MLARTTAGSRSILTVGWTAVVAMACSNSSPIALLEDASIGRDSSGTDVEQNDGGLAEAGNWCGIPECLRPVDCRANCNGPVVQTSCCPCPLPYFDDICCSSHSCP